jgi:hypothetical protein
MLQVVRRAPKKTAAKPSDTIDITAEVAPYGRIVVAKLTTDAALDWVEQHAPYIRESKARSDSGEPPRLLSVFADLDGKRVEVARLNRDQVIRTDLALMAEAKKIVGRQRRDLAEAEQQGKSKSKSSAALSVSTVVPSMADGRNVVFEISEDGGRTRYFLSASEAATIGRALLGAAKGAA